MFDFKSFAGGEKPLFYGDFLCIKIEVCKKKIPIHEYLHRRANFWLSATPALQSVLAPRIDTTRVRFTPESCRGIR
jgi:hypothetical protein